MDRWCVFYLQHCCNLLALGDGPGYTPLDDCCPETARRPRHAEFRPLLAALSWRSTPAHAWVGVFHGRMAEIPVPAAFHGGRLLCRKAMQTWHRLGDVGQLRRAFLRNAIHGRVSLAALCCLSRLSGDDRLPCPQPHTTSFNNKP